MSITGKDLETLRKRAAQVAARYERAVPWADAQEVEASAAVAMVDAYQRFDASKGPLGPFLWAAGRNAARRSVHEQGSPVTAKHRVEVLHFHKTTEVQDYHLTDGGDVVDEVERAEIAARVRARLAVLLGAEDGLPFAIAVLGGQYSVKEVAEAHGEAPRKVEALRAKVVAVLRADPELRALWKEQGQ